MLGYRVLFIKCLKGFLITIKLWLSWLTNKIQKVCGSF